MLGFQMKDVDVFQKNMFEDIVMEKMTGLKYWRSIRMGNTTRLEPYYKLV
jgi:hypothetical protein